MTELQQKYLEVSKEIDSIRNNINSNLDQYPDYLGWFDLRSPLIYNPDILFIGINFGPGRFVLENRNNWDKEAKRLKDESKKRYPKDLEIPWRSHLEWIKPGNARRKSDDNNKDEKEAEWWDSSKKMKNFFVYYMCELLVRIYRHEYSYPNVSRKELTDVFEKNVMATNLFPMSTFNIGGLNRLIKSYEKNNHIDITKVCRKHIADLIQLVNPHCVVLLGKTIEDDLSFALHDKPFYCINRNRGWHSKKNIKKMADDIYEMMRK